MHINYPRFSICSGRISKQAGCNAGKEVNTVIERKGDKVLSTKNFDTKDEAEDYVQRCLMQDRDFTMEAWQRHWWLIDTAQHLGANLSQSLERICWRVPRLEFPGAKQLLCLASTTKRKLRTLREWSSCRNLATSRLEVTDSQEVKTLLASANGVFSFGLKRVSRRRCGKFPTR